MARPNQELVDTLIGITGLPETFALQILQEHGGDLNRAVNAHFNDGDRAFARGTAVVGPGDDIMDIDEPLQHESSRNLNLPSLINPDFRGRVFDGAAEFTNIAPFVTHPSERRVSPIEVKKENGSPCHTGLPLTVEDATGRPQVRVDGHEADETIVIDDDGDDDAADNVPSASNAWDVRRTKPSAPFLNRMQEPDLDIEEEMIRAAIEASKREAEGTYSSEQFYFHGGSEGRSEFRNSNAQIGSSSFEGAGHQNSLRERVDHGKAETSSPEDEEFQKPLSEDERLGAGSSFIEGHTGILVNDTYHRQSSRRLTSGSVDSSTEVGEDVVSPPLRQGPQQFTNTNLPQIQQSDNGFHADEWGGISSAEHDEAVMLEAAMFGGIPETSEYNAFATHRVMQPNLNGNFEPYVRLEPRPPSPNLTAQRMLREQQDDEYLASLQADIEKAEARRLEEQAARDAALEEQKRKEEESLRKLDEEQELERQLVAKEASIPQDPSPDDVNAVNLLVRMPDGSRRGRRFLKSDKLKSLFDYIDIGRVVKPDTYRLVRPYPRRAFGDGDRILSLNELGLTSKQEALYLELV
uniref:UBX domain-containing protein n=1 Tax=Kalanchoe fedtschenkoi TaxID=63787 RepID=A0A7N0UQF9_KALFE